MCWCKIINAITGNKKAKGYSLHIGLNKVDPNHYGGWNGNLSACENDAKDMMTIAKKMGYNESCLLLTKAATRETTTNKLTEIAKKMKSGDILFLTYSGHGGQISDFNNDEEDGYDETWVLYDGQILDDELNLLYAKLPTGCRAIVISDSCHSGTITRSIEYNPSKFMLNENRKPKFMPKYVAEKTYLDNKILYDRTSKKNKELSKTSVLTKIKEFFEPKASIKLISGCQDDDVSYDGITNGYFTEKLLQIWKNGVFYGNYLKFLKKITYLTDSKQIPNLYNTGSRNKTFDNQKPFTI